MIYNVDIIKNDAMGRIVRDIELNLIVIFDCIMTEGSMTKAAQRLSMTQSAVSNAVARMRIVWQDPLFVRVGRGIKPSEKAQMLWRDINAPLAGLRAAMLPERFDPARSVHRFRLAVTDYISNAMWPALRRHIEDSAPGISIYAVPYTSKDVAQQLSANECDACFTGLLIAGDDIRTETLFTEKWVCAMRRAHPLAGSSLSMKNFLDAKHLLVSLSGNPAGPIDAALLRLEARRNVVMTLNNFGGVPSLLNASDLLCVVPEGVITTHAQRDTIHLATLPFELPDYRCQLAWHVRADRDPAQHWMRDLLTSTCAAIWGDQAAH